MRNDPQQLNSLALAYLGDAIYEVYVREYLLGDGQVKPQQLHNHAVRYVAAHAQASILHHWKETDMLTEEEIKIVRRGRNAKSKSKAKNMSISDYKHATAFEALIGFHYLMNHDERLEHLHEDAISFINEKSKKIE